MIITTGDAPAAHIVERAKKLAAETGVNYVPRNKMSLAKLKQKYNDDEIIVVVEGGARLFSSSGQSLHFHPSMGFVRAKRLLKGESDPMLDAARVEPGDIILDCTAGLGTDAIVFALKVGSRGKVIALESSLTLYTMLKEGLEHYKTGLYEVDEAMRRIEVKRAHHLTILTQLPDNSVDVVYFDPMFRDPIAESSSIKPLRKYANHEALHIESIREACRVARKCVLLKEKRDSEEFERLGFKQMSRGSSKIAYGVIDVDIR
ncbi:class I SAM-dependent methyltransferase [Paenibacillus sediminis]|uniref:SAM-dependent methyltransferase n=1 Tax=Paenibacillus sediminis TaxID=664909 RepID=A0ABS4H024_9BACL|nr:class I SAM-dependent methyltransferase [Paenibacillus sediminis]MBP1935880.1 hypothetical protein [Paenibacillus sediminis]